MSSIIIADRDFPLRLIAGPNERACEANSESATPATEPESVQITLITKRDEPSLMSKRSTWLCDVRRWPRHLVCTLIAKYTIGRQSDA